MLPKNTTKTEKSKNFAVISNVERLSEWVARVFRKHGFSTAMKPHRTLHSRLIHLKDRLLPHQKSEAIYEIPCADCPKSYIDETVSLLLLSNTNRLSQTTLSKQIKTSNRTLQKSLTRNLIRPPDGSTRPFGFIGKEITL